MQMMRKIVAGALALGLAGAAYAQGSLPALRISGSVSYLTGGVGLDESTAIKAAENNFTLSLLFAQSKRGEYLADVQVSIMDKAGNSVLQTASDGPMLLAKLPAGVYKISADHGGKVLSKTVTVGAKGVTRAAFVWQATAVASVE